MEEKSEMLAEGTGDNTKITGLTENKEDRENDARNDVKEEIPFLDLSNHWIKPDMFDGIHILDDSFEKIEGAPNFRQIPGFPVFGTGQPTEKAIEDIINRVKTGKENQKIIWFVMRQEPVVYINGESFAPRDPDNPHMNISARMEKDQIRSVESHLVKVLEKRKNESGNNTIQFKMDLEFAENPMEREDEKDNLTVEDLEEPEHLYRKCGAKCNVVLEVIRVPIAEDQMPMDYMDTIIDALKNEPASTPCVFNCQMGKGRTTVGMVAACLIKEIILTTELRSELKTSSSSSFSKLL